MKFINRSFLFIGLVLLDVFYSYTVVLFFKRFGIDINSFSLVNKCVSLIVIDITFMFILYLIFRKELNREFSRYVKNFNKCFSFGFKWWIIGLIVMMGSNFIIQSILGVSTATNENYVQDALSKMPVYIVFSSCIMAPFAEEIIFRKALRKMFNNDFLFIVMSGIIFGFVHNVSSIGSMQMLYIIPYGAFGVVFGYIYVKTNTIFTSMTFHFIHNSILVGISLLSLGVF